MRKLVISSRGPVAEFPKGCPRALGQYQYSGWHRHNRAPFYIKTDDSGLAPLMFLYRDAQRAWRAGEVLGSTDDCHLYHPPTEEDMDTPPLDGWLFRGVEDHELLQVDTTLVITRGPMHPPQTILIEATGEVAALYPRHLGTFTMTDEWYNGRPVYKNEDGKILWGGDEDCCLVGECTCCRDQDVIRSHLEDGHWRVWYYRGECGHLRRTEDLTLTATYSPTKLR